MRARRAAYRLANPLKRLTEEEKRARRKARSAAWYLANKAKHRADDRKWREKNKLKIAEYSKEYARLNPEVVRKSQAKYSAAHKAYYGAKTMERNARKRQAVAPWANKFFIEEIYDLARRRSALKSGGYAKWHVDHIVPLQHPNVCGFHVEHNLRVIPSIQNAAKGNRHWPDMP